MVLHLSAFIDAEDFAFILKWLEQQEDPPEELVELFEQLERWQDPRNGE